MTNQHQQNKQEEQATRERRSRDIDLYGYAGAFKKNSVISYEKYEWQRKNNKLREEKNNDRSK